LYSVKYPSIVFIMIMMQCCEGLDAFEHVSLAFVIHRVVSLLSAFLNRRYLEINSFFQDQQDFQRVLLCPKKFRQLYSKITPIEV
jgi:hypothetical protein